MGRGTMRKNLAYNRADNFHTYAEIPFIMLKIFLNEPAIIYVKKSPENRLMTVLALSLIRHLWIYTQNIIPQSQLMKV